MESVRYAYFIATLPALAIWLYFYVKREDLRREMLVISALIGLLSIVTSYYWWTVDWWRPLTITGTKVGIEDFISGFTSGGIMATIYEVVFKRGLYKRKLHHHVSGALTILFLLSQTTTLLFYETGLTSFWSATTAMLLTASVVIFIRKDLVMSSFLSAILMMLVSIPPYLMILLVSPQWIDSTYLPEISGIRIIGIPIEELVFWFLSGLVFGPF